MNDCGIITAILSRPTKYDLVDIEDVQSPIVRRGAGYWQSLRGHRAFPAREDIRPREIAKILAHMVVAKVVDGGRDFELRIVGDEVARAHCAPLINRRLSEVMTDLPRTAERWMATYRHVVSTKSPCAIRVRVGYETPEVNYLNAEVACLPLGQSDDCVDHLMTFGNRTLRFK